jgi:hypothetical protein
VGLRVLFRSVTKARELFQARRALSDGPGLKAVVDLPVDLSEFDREERKAFGGKHGADKTHLLRALSQGR